MSNFLRVWGTKILLGSGAAFFAVFLLVILVGQYDLKKEQSGKISLRDKNLEAISKIALEPVDHHDESARNLTPEPETANALSAVSKNNSGILPAGGATKRLADEIVKEILDKNPSGPKYVGGVQKLSVTRADELINGLISKGVEDFDYSSLKPEIKDIDLAVLNNPSPAAAAKYVSEFMKIMISGASIYGEYVSNPNDPKNDLATVINKLDEQIKALYALPVPLNFIEYSKQELSLLSANKKIFELASAYEGDPLKALLAVSSLGQVSVEMSNLFYVFTGALAENSNKNS